MLTKLESAPHGERVSVAMCTYKGATFLPEQLASILAQTRVPDQLVVCDDRSPDDTIAVLEAFAKQAPFEVKIFSNPETLLPAQNFAKCIALCDGDIILLSDQDDIWLPNRVEDTCAAFAANEAATFTFSDAPLIDPQGNALGRSIYSSLPLPREDRRLLEEGTSIMLEVMRWRNLYGCTMAFRSKYRSVILPVPELWTHDEWIATALSAVGPSARLVRPAILYRQHQSQVVGSSDWQITSQVSRASRRDRSAYEWELLRCERGIEAAEARPELRERLLPVLRDKADFLRERVQVQHGGLRALPLYARMLRTGKYRRFGTGSRTFVKDLLMLAGFFAGSDG